MNKRNLPHFRDVKRSALIKFTLALFAVVSPPFISHAYATIDNIVTVTGSSPTGSNDVEATATESVDVVDAINNLSIVKTATLNDELADDDFAEAGETITYTFDVTNTGNVTITNVTVGDTTNATNGPVVPSDEVVLVDGGASTLDSTDTSINGVWESLAPGDTVRFSATYTVTQEDVDTLN